MIKSLHSVEGELASMKLMMLQLLRHTCVSLQQQQHSDGPPSGPDIMDGDTVDANLPHTLSPDPILTPVCHPRSPIDAKVRREIR